MDVQELNAIARSIVADHKGVLAADESTGTIEKRFDSIGVKSTEENRRAYRNLLFTTPGFEEYVGGVILYDETIRQASDDGTPFAELLAEKGVVPGIKVDTGAKDLAGHPGEKVTEGLDGLRARFAEYHELGARFSKWRAVITIGDGIPTDACLHVNAHALARYAALSQEAGIVPIVEPEVLMDADNTIERCYEVTSRTLELVFAQRLHRAPRRQPRAARSRHGLGHRTGRQPDARRHRAVRVRHRADADEVERVASQQRAVIGGVAGRAVIAGGRLGPRRVEVADSRDLYPFDLLVLLQVDPPLHPAADHPDPHDHPHFPPLPAGG